MPKEIISNITDDILHLPEILFRSIRQKIIKHALAGISPLHFRIMKILKKETSLQVAEIADRMHVSRPQMTHLTDKLISLDMVERRIGTKDRRTINISLTSKGIASVNKNNRLVRSAIKESLSRLEPKDLQDLSDALVKTREIMSKAGITKIENP